MPADSSVNIQVPITSLLSPAMRWKPGQAIDVLCFDGYLRAIALGTLTVQCRDQSANLLATLTFTNAAPEPHVEFESPQPTVPDGGWIDFNVTGLPGIGADGCMVNVWIRAT